MSVTAMFTCYNKEPDNTNPEQGSVYLTAVTGGSEEANKYFAYTPGGQLTLAILNPNAFNQFETGKNYLLTIDEVQPQSN